jgi:hypothetical protein
MNRWPWLLILFFCAACAETTAAARVTLGTPAVLTAQADQYRRDAGATQAAQTATVAAWNYQAASTASAAQQTQIAVEQHATAQALAAGYTQAAVSTQAVRDATRQAGQDANATATAQAQIHADSVATLQHAQQATATAVVVGTQTTITLTTQQANATRAQVVNWIWFGVLVLIALAGLWMLVSLVDVLARRWSIAHYGPNRNPLVVLPGGVVYNPLTGIESGEELPEELKAQLAIMGQQVLALQAQHSPHAPVKPEPAKSVEWKVGPVSAKTTTSPAVSVEKPALAQAAPVKQLSEPEPETLFVKDPANTLRNRDASDKWEFITRSWPAKEGGGGVGLSRASWQGKKFDGTGNRITPKYWAELVDKLVMCQVAETDGRGEAHPVLSLSEALDAFGLAHYDEATPSKVT